MVTQSNPKFFKRFEALLNEHLEKDLDYTMNAEVLSEAKLQVRGQGSLNTAIANKSEAKKDRKSFDSHTDIDEYHPAGHLNVQTGNLSKSIVCETDREGDVITSIVGSNSKYAKIHELGGDIEYKDKDITYHFKGYHVKRHESHRNGKTFTVRAHNVRPHTATLHRKARVTHIPARPFLVPALELRKDNVIKYMSDRVKEYAEMAAK